MAAVAWIDFKAVAQAVTAREVAEFERLDIDKTGRCKCPWCPSTTSRRNLAFNADGTAHCYRCHETHDAIDLAQRLWRVSKADAARQLITIFKLGVSDEKPDAEQRQQREAERAERWAEQLAEWQAENELMSEAAVNLREAEADLWADTSTDWNPALIEKLRRYTRARMRWDWLFATQRRITRPQDPKPDRQQLEAAVKAAQDEQAAAWAKVRATDATADNYNELLRQARNADDWLRLKRTEANLGGRV